MLSHTTRRNKKHHHSHRDKKQTTKVVAEKSTEQTLDEEMLAAGDEILTQVTTRHVEETQKEMDVANDGVMNVANDEVMQQEQVVASPDKQQRKKGKKKRKTQPKKARFDVMPARTRPKRKRGSPIRNHRNPGVQKKKTKISHGIKKPHRYRPGTVAIREIRKLQHTNKETGRKFCIPRASFKRLIKQTISGIDGDVGRITKEAVEVLQVGAEEYLTSLFEDTNLATVAFKKVTITDSTMSLIRQLRSEISHKNYDKYGYGRTLHHDSRRDVDVTPRK